MKTKRESCEKCRYGCPDLKDKPYGKVDCKHRYGNKHRCEYCWRKQKKLRDASKGLDVCPCECHIEGEKCKECQFEDGKHSQGCSEYAEPKLRVYNHSERGLQSPTPSIESDWRKELTYKIVEISEGRGETKIIRFEHGFDLTSFISNLIERAREDQAEELRAKINQAKKHLPEEYSPEMRRHYSSFNEGLNHAKSLLQ